MIKATWNMDDVLKKFGKMQDKSKDLSPAFLLIRGTASDKRTLTLIGGINAAFLTQGGVYGKPWKSLSAEYMARKLKKYSAATTLIASGNMYRSVTIPGSAYNVEIVGTRTYAWGTVTPYAGYHQSKAPRKKLPRRPFMDIRKEQKAAWNNLITEYILSDTLDAVKIHE